MIREIIHFNLGKVLTDHPGLNSCNRSAIPLLLAVSYIEDLLFRHME